MRIQQNATRALDVANTYSALIFMLTVKGSVTILALSDSGRVRRIAIEPQPLAIRPPQTG